MTTVYITKYAFTRGIIKAEAEILDGYAIGTGDNLWLLVPRKEWFTDEDAARAYVEVKRSNRLKSLQKATRKLTTQVIEVVTV